MLKMLHDPKDSERRGRMQREIDSLGQLKVKGVPRLIDASPPSDSPPYIVMEFMSGRTLSKQVPSEGLTLAEAVNLTDQLLSILEACHQKGVIHRDIKPDNILASDGLTDVALVDFGLSVDEDEETTLTADDQDVGNRFLVLPSHRAPGANKRDPRDDVTMCAGVFFYTLTGKKPAVLRDDDDDQPPHRRANVQELLARLSAHQQVSVAQFFDKAFARTKGERYQTASEMREGLNEVLVATMITPPPKSPSVESLWTLQVLYGEPTSLYFNHRVNEEVPTDLAQFFRAGGDIVIHALDTSVQAAIGVLWQEVSCRREIQLQIPRENSYRHALDHLNHQLDESWVGHGQSTGEIYWNRERLFPDGAVPGPSASIVINALSAAGQAAVGILDQAARENAIICLAEAEERMNEWQRQDR